MSHSAPDPNDDHGSVYDGLLGTDTSQWAFGTDFEDPLAGVDTTVPEGVDPAALAAYCLMLGDDALVLSNRLSEWCSRAPDLEDDIALTNISLDLLGQARLLLARAAAADPTVVPALPEGSPIPPEDALAFFREAGDFRNVRLVEVPNGDFADTVARVLVFACARLAVFEKLAASLRAVRRTGSFSEGWGGRAAPCRVPPRAREWRGAGGPSTRRGGLKVLERPRCRGLRRACEAWGAPGSF